MLNAVIDLVASVLVTAAIMLLPGAALVGVLGAFRVIDPLLRPAAAVAGTIAMSSFALVLTLWLHWSIMGYGLVLLLGTLVLGILALLRHKPGRGMDRGERLRAVGGWVPPSLVLLVVGILDAPQVRSDTYWHMALARKLGAFDDLSSAKLAFEAGAPGNPNYPLPSWHALISLADHAPRVDLWSATWFLTLWMAPVAMLAFGAMAAALVGDRRAGLVGGWTFAAVVVLGYGPWYFATRYLSYAGQIAIYILLPLAVTALVCVSLTAGRRRLAHIGVATGATVLIGVLHGNYVLYPVLFATGGAVLMLLGRRESWRSAAAALVAVGAAGVLTLGAQLPWITNDENFLRGDSDPTGEPTAFMRHRDAFEGTEDSHHVVLGYLAAQPLLVIGALAIVGLLWYRRRRPGPWHLAGGAAAIVVFARTPQLIELIDKLGSVTPATRFDRVYPAAVGVVALALGGGWLIEQAWRRGRRAGAAATVGGVAVVAALAWWLDSVRDTKRIVVTPFVEARWVGGLDPDGVPQVTIIVVTLASLALAAFIRLRRREGTFERDLDADHALARHGYAALLVAAIVVGLAPASIERLEGTWQPEAYVRAQRADSEFTRIEVYPPKARDVIATFEDGAVVLAAFNDTRRIASLAPVYSIEESVLRQVVADPPAPGAEAAARLDELVREWDADYVAANAFDKPFRPMLEAAAADPERYELIASGNLRVFRVNDDGVDA